MGEPRVAEYVKHEWAGAWMCTVFRNEAPDVARSSELIREAVAATLARWGEPPALGMVTFVDPEKTRKKRDPGRCFRRAGFREVGRTKEANLVALQLMPADMPEPELAKDAQVTLFDGETRTIDRGHWAFDELSWDGGAP